jgi:hypothetical protein
MALGYENRYYKYIFTVCFLKVTTNRNHVFLVVVNLRKTTNKNKFILAVHVWTHNFISSDAYRLGTATGKKMVTTQRNRFYTSVEPPSNLL